MNRDDQTASDDTQPIAPSWTRRGLIAGVAAAGAGAAAGLALGATPAGAADGGSVLLGEPNTATVTTQITSSNGDGFDGITTDDGANGVAGYDNSPDGGQGLYGASNLGTGVYGQTTGTGKRGVWGVVAGSGGGFGVWGETNANGTGVYGQSANPSGLLGAEFAGVIGDSDTNDGVAGFSSAGVGVRGITTADGANAVVGNDQSTTGGVGVYGLSNAGTGVVGDSNAGTGVSGISVGQSGVDSSQAGVIGDSDTNDGVIGMSSQANGVFGITTAERMSGVYGSDSSTLGGFGVYAQSTAGNAFKGVCSANGNAAVIGSDQSTTGGQGIYGSSTAGTGVLGYSANGYGIVGEGGLAPLWLNPSATTGPPTTGTHAIGELYIDKDGTLYTCVAEGAPGMWSQVSAGPSTFAQGAFCLLPNPIRLLDTRTGASDAVSQPGMPVSAGDTSPLQVTGAEQDSIAVPAGAVAVIGNVTAVNAVGRGFLTLWPVGPTQPKTSSLNFPETTSVANGVTVALSSAGKLNIFASTTTDVIFDATGFIA